MKIVRTVNYLGKSVVEEIALQMRGNVHVENVVSLVTVMVQVILLEGDGRGHTQGNVGNKTWGWGNCQELATDDFFNGRAQSFPTNLRYTKDFLDIST